MCSHRGFDGGATLLTTLKGSLTGQGYRRVFVNRKTLLVHRLVAAAFHGHPPFDGAVVRHLDGNPLNNHADNLRWGTQAENAADRIAHGRSMRGSENVTSKLNEEQVQEIRSLRGSLRGREVAQRFGIALSTVYELWQKNPRNWRWLSA